MLRQTLPVAFLTLMLAGCAASGSPSITRALPPVASIIPPAVLLPSVRPGGDVVTAAAEHRAVAAENGRRLQSASRNYEAVRRQYQGGE